MIIRTTIALCCCLVLVSCDYGSKPKIIFKEAGPSREYRWVGYTNHYPKTIPRLPIIHKWNPYSDPLYTASWVPHKPKGHGTHGKHASKGHDIKGSHSKGHGKIPHGFGPPKPSSVSGGYSGDQHGDFSQGHDIGHGGGYSGGHSAEFSKGHDIGHGGGYSGGHSAEFSKGHDGGFSGGHGGDFSKGIGGGFADEHSADFSQSHGGGHTGGLATGYVDFSTNSIGQSNDFVHSGIVESVDLIGAGHFNGDSNFGSTQGFSQTYQEPEPIQTYQEPTQTYQEPIQTYQEPIQTYQEPIQTYQEPIQTYQEPIQTYQEPIQTYQEPIQTYQEPIQTYQEPIQTYQEPIQTYQEPIQTYQEPIQTYQEPIQTYQEPIQTYQEPIQTYQEPIQTYQEPIQTYQGPNSHVVQSSVQIGQGGQVYLDLDPRVPNIPVVEAYSGDSDEQFRDNSGFESVVPLVYPPHSAPLPLENEGTGAFNNNFVF